MYIAADIEKIKSVFKKVFKDYCISCTIDSCNNYKSILIEQNSIDEDNYLYMWIRLSNVHDTALYNVDIANITLPKKLRRCGVLTAIYKGLTECKYVNKVRFISVCTEEMKSWCNKHGLQPYNDDSDYTN